MSYTPTVWATGDTITAEKLNKAENGIAAASALIIPLSWEGHTATLDASYDELIAAKNHLIIAQGDYTEELGLDRFYLTALYIDSDVYYAVFMTYEGGGQAASSLVLSATSSSADMTYRAQ